MAVVQSKGRPVTTIGDLPKVGSPAPDFTLTTTDLRDVTLKDFAGRKLILNIVHSIDTGVCAASTRRFNEIAARLKNTVVATVSADLPFAHGRFAAEEGIEDVILLSQIRNREFGRRYGVEMLDGPLAGLLARSVVVVDEHGRVIYTQQVQDLGRDPDYDGAVRAVQTAA